MSGKSKEKLITTPNVRVRVLVDVPADEKDTVVADFESGGATVVAVKQNDGKWAVTATWVK